jgi:hypothetical protein
MLTLTENTLFDVIISHLLSSNKVPFVAIEVTIPCFVAVERYVSSHLFMDVGSHPAR